MCLIQQDVGHRHPRVFKHRLPARLLALEPWLYALGLRHAAHGASRTLIAQANAQDHAAMETGIQRGRILGEGAVRGGVQRCLVSISSACLRVVSVISLPPDMRAISSMRSAKLSGWMSVVVWSTCTDLAMR